MATKKKTLKKKAPTRRRKKDRLTPQQRKQYNLLKSRFRISEKYFLQYYKDVRKAHKRIADFARRNTLFKGRNISLRVDRIESRAEFNARYKKVKDILTPDFKERQQRIDANNIITNLKDFAGLTDNDILIKRLKALPPKDLLRFVNENSDIQKAAFYHRGDAGAEILEVIDIEYGSFLERLDLFQEENNAQ